MACKAATSSLSCWDVTVETGSHSCIVKAQDVVLIGTMRNVTGQTHNHVVTRADCSAAAAAENGDVLTGNRCTSSIGCVGSILAAVRDHVVRRMTQEGAAHTVINIIFTITGRVEFAVAVGAEAAH